MFKYLVLLYETIIFPFINLFKKNNQIQNNFSFPILDLDKINNSGINKIIFVLNNIPGEIHKILFKDNPEINPEYYFININHNNSGFDKNFDKLDLTYRFIYIRINIFNNKYINHLNSIIIDNIQKYIFIFEPKTDINYNINIILELLGLNNYKIYIPADLKYNQIQKFDLFCQTYIIFVFYLIINNKNLDINGFKDLFDNYINHDNLLKFLNHIQILLNNNKLEINYGENLSEIPANFDINSDGEYIILDSK